MTTSHLPCAKLTVPDVLSGQARSHPNRVALRAKDTAYSYGRLHRVTNQIAHGLQDKGVGQGSIVAMLGRNSEEHVLVQHAVAKLGAALAVINWRQSSDEVKYAIDLVQPQLLLVQEEFNALIGDPDVPRLTYNQNGSPEFWAELVDGFADADIDVDVDPEAIVTILYTSGTTGRPKAAAISQRAMLARASYAASGMELTGEDAHVAWAPMYHLVSADFVFICAVLASQYIVVDGFDVEAINHYIHEYPLGWLALAPGTFEQIIARVKSDPRPVQPIKLVGAMADLVPPTTMSELTELLGSPYFNSYGMTEAGPIAIGAFAPGLAPKDLGKVLTPFVKSRIVDSQGEAAAVDVVGELLLRGPTLFSGYLNDSEATAEVVEDGWYRTGDLLKQDSEGKFHFVGRSKYLIKSGGENIYPAEIERVLLTCDHVIESVVVGVPDPHWGETPVAFVAADGPVEIDELMRACRKDLAGYKVPRQIRVIDYEQFPRNVTGKVIRQALEDLATAEPA